MVIDLHGNLSIKGKFREFWRLKSQVWLYSPLFFYVFSLYQTLCFVRCRLVLLVLGPNQLLLLIQHLSLFHAYSHSHSTFVLCSHALVDPFLPLIAHLTSKSCGYKAKLLAGQNQIFYLQYSLWIHSNWVKGLLCYFCFGIPQGKTVRQHINFFPSLSFFALSFPLSSPLFNDCTSLL